jgi:putative transposase
MALKYWNGAHTKHRLMYHVVWLPKYRKKVLQTNVKRRLKTLFYEATKLNQWWIEELKIKDDHVHMLIQIHPNEKISNVIRILKGGSSKIIRKEFPELEAFLWGDNFWAKGYFVETVGSLDYSKVKSYIKKQDQFGYATDSTSSPS